MTLNQLSSKLTNALRGFLACEFKVVLTVAAILFTANLAYSAYTVGFTNGQAFESSRNYTVSGDDSFMIRLRIATSLGLFVCVAGLAFRRSYGFLASMLGIIWLVLVYGWWQSKSVAFLKNLEVPDYSALPDVSHAAGLRGGSLWDLLVLVIATIIFIWQAVAIVRVLRSPDDVFSSGASLLRHS
jgi:hypothetical protein